MKQASPLRRERLFQQFSKDDGTGGYPCHLWENHPAIPGDVVYRVPRCLTECQPVSPLGPLPAAPTPCFGHTPGHAKGPFPD